MLPFFSSLLAVFAVAQSAPQSFPEPVSETRPWGICHVLGSATETEELAREMKRWSDGGLGGVRVVPIYRARGYEDRAVNFLSPEFLGKLGDWCRLSEANGLKYDLSFGAGWCFGGRHVPPELGVQALRVVKDGETLPPRHKVLFAREGMKLVAYLTGQKVKRTQPSDTGPMLNPLSPAAFKAHLAAFASLDGAKGTWPRATFHDSFEYVRAHWSAEFPALFRKYRGYSIEDHYAELAGLGDAETVARVKCDYRETVNDILVKETFPLWTQWCRERGILTHNQAHGAPANLLEFYAIADTPETEMFGRGKRDKFTSRFDARFREGSRSPLMAKFASSAAHLTGKKHTSAESFTWMAEHFCETLEEAKAFGDLFFLGGVNRLYFHATVYSPDSAPWPGWCFYAASELNPRNPIWHDIRPLNDYFSRVQSLMTDAEPDNDVLLFWPIHDQWTKADGMTIGFGMEPRWMQKTNFGRLAQKLTDAGYCFDYVSDAFLSDETVSRYKAIVVPECRNMKNATFERLKKLAERMPVIFEKTLPLMSPGLAGAPLDRADAPQPAADAVAALAATHVRRDAFAGVGSQFDCVRMKWKSALLYFVVNSSVADGMLELPDGAVVLDPMSGDVFEASARRMPPASSCFVWLKDGEIKSRGKQPCEADAKRIALEGPWSLEFTGDVSGWPLPERRKGAVLGDWTKFGERETEFSGSARYRTGFRLDAAEARSASIVLNLGEVCNSAKVWINGKPVGTVFMHPYRIALPTRILSEGDNTLDVEVTNLGANRIRAYDRKGVQWKTFENWNVSSYGGGGRLDARNWPVHPSGLLGPVCLELERGEVK